MRHEDVDDNQRNRAHVVLVHNILQRLLDDLHRQLPDLSQGASRPYQAWWEYDAVVGDQKTNESRTLRQVSDILLSILIIRQMLPHTAI